MNKLNFGCGDRIADGWVNIDFSSSDKRVKRVNLLKGLPFADCFFDVVYSSHVIEHFTPDQAMMVLSEVWRVLKPGGILRIVVPDLEQTCKEYIRIISLPDYDSKKCKMYEWILIELLDQLVRVRPGGMMGQYFQVVMNSDDGEHAQYVRSRVQNTPLGVKAAKSSFSDKLRRISIQKIVQTIRRLYLGAVKRLIPAALRPLIFIETGIGERHRWMYDVFGLTLLLKKTGFKDIRSLKYNESNIDGFNNDCLDCNSSGESYKNNSIYFEAVK